MPQLNPTASFSDKTTNIPNNGVSNHTLYLTILCDLIRKSHELVVESPVQSSGDGSVSIIAPLGSGYSTPSSLLYLVTNAP